MMLLCKNLLRIYRARFQRLRASRMRLLFALIGLLFLPGVIVLQTQQLFETWLYFPNGDALVVRFLSTTMMGIMVLLFLSGMPSALHHFFLANDLPLLRVLPLPAPTIYLQKVIETSVSNAGLFVLLGLPLWISALAAWRVNALIVVFALLMAVMFVLVVSGASILFALLFARIGSVKKMRRIASFILALFMISVWALFQFLHISKLNPLSPEFEQAAVEQFASSSLTAPRAFLPSSWFVMAIVSAKNSEWLSPVFYASLFVLIAALLIGLVLLFRLYLDGKDVQVVTHKSLRRHQSRSPLIFRFGFAVLQKDFRLFYRDLRVFQSTLILFAMIVVAPFMTNIEPHDTSGTLALFMPYITLTFLVLLVSSAMSRQNVPMEQMAFEYIKLAPVSMRSYLRFKVWRSASILIGVSLFSLLILFNRVHTPPGLFVWTSATLVVLALGGSALGQMFGALGARFDWSDPRYMVGLNSSLVSTAVLLMYGLLGSAIFMAGHLLNQHAIAFVLFFFYVWLVFEVATKLAAKHLDALEWNY